MSTARGRCDAVHGRDLVGVVGCTRGILSHVCVCVCVFYWMKIKERQKERETQIVSVRIWDESREVLPARINTRTQTEDKDDWIIWVGE